MNRFWSKVRKGKGCWMWTASVFKSSGYGAFFLDGRPRGAHRVAFELANGPIPPTLCVCHSCDEPRCVNPAHLFLGTHSDNAQDAFAKGRRRAPSGGPGGTPPIRRGAANGNSRLTEALVKEIRTSAETNRAIARRLDIDKGTVAQIRNRITWGHVL